MTLPHIIRVERIRVDPVAARAEGIVIRREANGGVTRQTLSVPGNPVWTSTQAEAALLARAVAD